MYLTFIASPGDRVTATPNVDRSPYTVRIDVHAPSGTYLCSWNVHVPTPEGAKTLAKAYNDAYGDERQSLLDRAEALAIEAQP